MVFSVPAAVGNGRSLAWERGERKQAFPNADLPAVTDLVQETLGLYPVPSPPTGCAGDAAFSATLAPLFMLLLRGRNLQCGSSSHYPLLFFLKSINLSLQGKINNSSCQWMQAGESDEYIKLLRPKLETDNLSQT